MWGCGGGKKCIPAHIAWILVIVGALNWGLVGLFDFNLVMTIFGSWPMVERVIYVLVGVGAVVSLVGCRCKMCKAGCENKNMSNGGMNQPKM